jgi:hypothetical protein
MSKGFAMTFIEKLISDDGDDESEIKSKFNKEDNRLEILKFLYIGDEHLFYTDILSTAVSFNRPMIVKWILDKKIGNTEDYVLRGSIEIACTRGYLEILEYLISFNDEVVYITDMMLFAVKYNNIEIMKYLYLLGKPNDISSIITKAIIKDYIDILKIFENDLTIDHINNAKKKC